PREMVFHDLRHTTATLLLRAGINPHHVQRILRHASINTTTAIYGHLQTDDLREGLATVFRRAPEVEEEPAEQVANGEQEGIESFGPPVVRSDADPKSKGLNPGFNPSDSGPFLWSGKRDLNPRPSPWQGDALPLSYSRMGPPKRRSIWHQP